MRQDTSSTTDLNRSVALTRIVVNDATCGGTCRVAHLHLSVACLPYYAPPAVLCLLPAQPVRCPAGQPVADACRWPAAPADSPAAPHEPGEPSASPAPEHEHKCNRGLGKAGDHTACFKATVCKPSTTPQHPRGAPCSPHARLEEADLCL